MSLARWAEVVLRRHGGLIHDLPNPDPTTSKRERALEKRFSRNCYLSGANVYQAHLQDQEISICYAAAAANPSWLRVPPKSRRQSFAAGNDGTDETPVDGVTDRGRIGAEASAKNCITVGATESRRPDIRWTPPPWNPNAKTFTYGEFFRDLYPRDPIASDHMANNDEGMAAFSSFGPTVERRIKPDVVAPGTSILSTRSRDITEVPTHYGISDDGAWMFDTETSMATPLVAGCCAVLRETQVKKWPPIPECCSHQIIDHQWRC
ncbi:peptidase S8/S53 domain-containing protein [Dactylonectria estremocensis]|uniref:Peptidase S8/S53 domain-containing protein n=1 Tax=Dactylonectria estremocensis TaxID=1079267 RepID=A0A9P9EYH2_9HYPO|nr:peptidase S8/S53 domain-containing protein [Dactylonectria estremocensis]